MMCKIFSAYLLLLLTILFQLFHMVVFFGNNYSQWVDATFFLGIPLYLVGSIFFWRIAQVPKIGVKIVSYIGFSLNLFLALFLILGLGLAFLGGV